MRMQIDKTRKYELIAYFTVWAAVFLTPLVAYYVETTGKSGGFQWRYVVEAWTNFLPFFIFFWLHDTLVAPMLVRKGRIKRYIVFFIVTVAVFMMVRCATRVEPVPTPPDNYLPRRPKMEMEAVRPPKPDERPPHNHLKRMDEPLNPALFISLAVAVMMCGLNIAVKLYFKAREDETALIELEKQNLQKELEYLRYQINPHFFMNTLNNIHALVDIDPESAKQTVIDLSKLMRYVLYEGAMKTVPLAHEIDFVRNYLALMKLRYTDKVGIKVRFPEAVPDLKIAPMLLITFVENAFKHGISYRKPSFIDINVKLEEQRLTFSCVNSIAPRLSSQPGGVGLANVKKRLALIYKDAYDLEIKPDAERFSVTLTIPLTL